MQNDPIRDLARSVDDIFAPPAQDRSTDARIMTVLMVHQAIVEALHKTVKSQSERLTAAEDRITQLEEDAAYRAAKDNE